MTTIACDGRCMAADGRGVKNDIIFAQDMVKITRLKDGSLLGFSGNSSLQLEIAKWLNEGGDFPKTEAEYAALQLMGDGEVRLYTTKGEQYYAAIAAPASVGSGCELALGAMLAGVSPDKAVALACERDPFSGGTITVEFLS